MTNNIAGYIRVQKDLKKMIIKGVYNQGDMLPSENKLSSEYGLSRMTIRHALSNLEIEGLIYRKKGKGSFVGSKAKSFKLLSRRGFTEVMKGRDIEVETEFILKPFIKGWDDNFYWSLSEKEIEAGCINFQRVRKILNKPVMLEESFMSNLFLPDFCSTPFFNNSLFDTLMINYDIEIAGVSQKFRAVSASQDISERLNIKKGDAVLKIIRKLTTSKPNLNIYSILHFNTDDFTVEV